MKIGDQISVIDEDLKGVVTSVHENMVVLRDKHGFTYQFPMEKVVLQQPDLYQNIPMIKKPETQKNISKKHHKNQLILDLHFEQLVPNPKNYTAYERLFLQKEKLLETIEFCRKNKIKKLEIIHGIGDGTLQKMVNEVLKSQRNLDFYNTEILHQQSGSVIVNF